MNNFVLKFMALLSAYFHTNLIAVLWKSSQEPFTKLPTPVDNLKNWE